MPDPGSGGGAEINSDPKTGYQSFLKRMNEE